MVFTVDPKCRDAWPGGSRETAGRKCRAHEWPPLSGEEVLRGPEFRFVRDAGGERRQASVGMDAEVAEPVIVSLRFCSSRPSTVARHKVRVCRSDWLNRTKITPLLSGVQSWNSIPSVGLPVMRSAMRPSKNLTRNVPIPRSPAVCAGRTTGKASARPSGETPNVWKLPRPILTPSGAPSNTMCSAPVWRFRDTISVFRLPNRIAVPSDDHAALPISSRARVRRESRRRSSHRSCASLAAAPGRSRGRGGPAPWRPSQIAEERQRRGEHPCLAARQVADEQHPREALGGQPPQRDPGHVSAVARKRR